MPRKWPPEKWSDVLGPTFVVQIAVNRLVAIDRRLTAMEKSMGITPKPKPKPRGTGPLRTMRHPAADGRVDPLP